MQLAYKENISPLDRRLNDKKEHRTFENNNCAQKVRVRNNAKNNKVMCACDERVKKIVL